LDILNFIPDGIMLKSGDNITFYNKGLLDLVNGLSYKDQVDWQSPIEQRLFKKQEHPEAAMEEETNSMQIKHSLSELINGNEIETNTYLEATRLNTMKDHDEEAIFQCIFRDVCLNEEKQ